MSIILATIGRGQLRVLDKRVAAKRRIFEQYRQLLADLPGITFMPEPPYGRCNRTASDKVGDKGSNLKL
jgi:pyridoxal phosphate-dependent aminotransferase EpsN